MRFLKWGCLPLVVVFIIVAALMPSTPDPDLSPDVSPSVSATPTPTPTPIDPASLDYWPNALVVTDITDSTSRNCTYDMCLILKIKANHACSKITLAGTTYTVDDEEVDSFENDFGKIKKGKTITVEFGTDATQDNEDYVELDDSTCWK